MKKPEADGDVTVHPAELPTQGPAKPVYPHSEWIENLLTESETRRLTKSEVIAITEASMFQNLIENALPELREQVGQLPEGIEHDNAQMYIEVAADFAKGLGGDISVAMQRAFRRAVVGVAH